VQPVQAQSVLTYMRCLSLQLCECCMVYRYKKGYKNVIDKACELNSRGVDSQLAIETSGHGALKENHMLDDGAYMAMKVSTTI
jgi:Phosphoglucomutase/phosphomannomutase, alpha/beta/alpha domain III